MMRQERAFIALFLSFFLFWACAVPASGAGIETATVETAKDTYEFGVELALTDEARAKGLMFRRELAPDKGMLFIFQDVERRSFWMKNTYIPLDIIFIRKNGQIANIVENAEPETLTSRPSRGRVVAVLEIAGGRAAELGIKPGDVVRHVLLGNAGDQ